MTEADHTRAIAYLKGLEGKEAEDLGKLKDRYRRLTNPEYREVVKRHVDLQDSLVTDLNLCIRYLENLSKRPKGF